MGTASERGRGPRRERRAAARGVGAAGFSLIELLVVIIVIGLVAALAVPAMSVARFDRLAYNDAGAVMQLLRSARTHAIARGGAVLVTMHADGTDRGTFMMYEAVSANVLGGSARTPLATCKAPTDWTLATGGAQNTGVLAIDGVNLNGNLENSADIRASIKLYVSPTDNAGTNEPTPLAICWTPVGRSYIALGNPAAHMFDGLLPTISPLEIAVARTRGGTVRSVLVPPNGMARLFSRAVTVQP
ncbi:MAG: prepilin-type N-terminal cleavage/methylation domain-containing protein [Myxococcales bacterium]|nr:prepilin-type N-terminal cleavage/methylation domain-containing protein [Myxococcales bacterium]